MREADGRTNELKAEVEAAAAAGAALETELAEKAADMAAVSTEKELQAGGEVKELAAHAEQLSKQCALNPKFAKALCLCSCPGGGRSRP